ncbi:uncharacterized protein BDW43DRAFT_292075 [Aspergillus alliaceus]|uniref:uncharacterized protein n=1 Tax=Petromyces alliaceus TaxID=209559 RepID=UPI0012A5C571|nr:uncharacterized protein BDW43DRAFT_292075 [Aspergillus alliaceus]KAB8228188.1 hypothetical protein BDW43DRAFT_292075 [Aspergillus alliaceus]
MLVYRICTIFRLICLEVEYLRELEDIPPLPESENCLYLDIFTPASHLPLGGRPVCHGSMKLFSLVPPAWALRWLISSS